MNNNVVMSSAINDDAAQESKTALGIASIGLGIVFGFLLVSIGATTFDYLAKMFLFQDFQLPIVLGLSFLTAATGMWMLGRMKARTLFSEESVKGAAEDDLSQPMSKRLVIGALFFGTGWGLTASCPGTALVMLGEGKLIGLPVVGGIFFGTVIYGLYNKFSHSK